MNRPFQTADLCDAHDLQVVAPGLRHFGGLSFFSGSIATIKVFEDNTLVRQELEQPGSGRVLVVDAGGSMRCAMLGDILAKFAVDHGWAGVVMHGCIRDVAMIAQMPIGVAALATHPKKSQKHGAGQSGVTVRFMDAEFRPGEFLYADEDGIVVSAKALL